MTIEGPEPLLRAERISKGFGNVLANDRVSCQAFVGEILAILGENGAGKTTFVNIIAGLYRPDAGSLFWNGQPVFIRSPADALRLGIGMVHQRFMLVPTLSVTENLLLVMSSSEWILSHRRAASTIREVSARYGLDVAPEEIVGRLSVGERQRLEILKSLVRKARLLILDEPTSVLSPEEVGRFWDVLQRLRDEGLSVLLITHKLPEARVIADRIAVLRQGRVVGTWGNSDVSDEALVQAIIGPRLDGNDDERGSSPELQDAITELLGVGTPLVRMPQYHSASERRIISRLVGVSTSGHRVNLNDVRLAVCAGEIVGVAGVDGNGQSALARILAGVERPAAGRVERGDQHVRIGFVPAERIGTGLIGQFTVTENALTRSLNGPWYGWRRFPPLLWRRVRRHAQRLIARYAIKADPSQEARDLSGGNQQKLILARETERGPALMVVEQPTQGLDVAATAVIIARLRRLASEGVGIVWISSNLDELIREAHRIVILYQGRLVGEVPPGPGAAQAAGRLMLGLRDQTRRG